MDHFGMNLLPRVGELINDLNGFVVWDGQGKDQPRPITGILPAFDKI